MGAAHKGGVRSSDISNTAKLGSQSIYKLLISIIISCSFISVFVGFHYINFLIGYFGQENISQHIVNKYKNMDGT